MRISGQNILEINERKIIPVRKCMETEIKCNSVFRTIGEDRAWWDR